VCVVDGAGRIVRESKVASEPEALIGWFGKLGLSLERIGLEAGPLSQWLYAALRQAGLSTRHVRNALNTMRSRPTGACGKSPQPLTPTLSPQGRGEGEESNGICIS
jgi:hypothetical protein